MFLTEQAIFKNGKAKFEEVKENFYKIMDEYFNSQGLEDNASVVFNNSIIGSGASKVTRIQRVNVEFKVDKLEKVLPKEVAKKVIVKRYEITNMEGLISYLKKCNVDPQVFKSFLNVDKQVDTKEMDKMEELGKITIEQIKGCYSVKKSNPYYNVSEVK